MKNIQLGSLILFVFFSIFVSAQPSELRVKDNRLFISVEINGLATEALLDSGSEMTVIDADFAKKLALNSNGSASARGTGSGTVQVRFAKHVEIKAVDVTLTNRTVVILDLSDISERLVGEKVNMIIGRDLFDSGRFFLDINAQVFKKINTAKTPPGSKLILRENKGIKQIPISIEGAKIVYADFDLGNGSEVSIGHDYAQNNGLLSTGRVLGNKVGGGIGGTVNQQLIKIQRIQIAEQSFSNVIATIDSSENQTDANVGGALLRNFTMVIDFSENSIWLMPNIIER